jgi:hypothetical protein
VPVSPRPASPVPDPDPFADSGAGFPSGWREYAPSDDELEGLGFDPDNSPPDGADAWLADLPSPVRDAYADAIAAQAPAEVPETLAAGFTHGDGGCGRGFAAGGLLDEMPPGPVLAGFASDAWAGGLHQLSDDELIGVVCGWRRQASWSAAGEAAAVGELAGRRAAQSRDGGNRHLAEHVDSEIAAALTLTGRAAGRLLELAAGLARLPGTATALAGGRIDWPRAIVIIDELSALSDAEAAAVEARVLGDAPGRTTGQLRAVVRRQVLAADPEAAIRRREKAQKEARVETWTEPSGTGSLAGRDLPPAEVITADKRLDADARWLKSHGADGTLSQLRARAFSARLSGLPLETLLSPAGAGPATDRPGTDRPGTNAPGTNAPGTGDPGTGDPGNGPGSGGPGGRPGGPGSALPPGPAGSVNLTMPLSSWLGRSNAPGEAAGLDPLDAATCRDLAAALATDPRSGWCLTITSPDGRAIAHGCARAGPGPPGTSHAAWLRGINIKWLEAGDCTHQRQTPAYRAPRSLRHLISIRQRNCSYPGCRQQAIRIDHDHTIPFDQGGRTCECNLSPLCRTHHQAKQCPGWLLEQPAPGDLTWTLPSGRRYAVTPDAYPL